ncbi:hypothetical protein [Chitinilyticum litopenaei]|uniref:hypothetical protein n=1 Tax=Chitinilyticum litopenaei TaxID=1121276 RepID=UPI000429E853|nr:hypothetical protein [Chitinilyticum litopenaei]
MNELDQAKIRIQQLEALNQALADANKRLSNRVVTMAHDLQEANNQLDDLQRRAA